MVYLLNFDDYMKNVYSPNCVFQKNLQHKFYYKKLLHLIT